MRKWAPGQHRQADQPAPPDTGPAAPVPAPRAPAAGQDRGPAARDGAWDPLVVGEPVFGFEPRPPDTVSYRPDTIFDGWSSDRFAVRLASVRGYSHRYAGTPRQDSAVVMFHPATGTVIFAVADGVSAAPQSAIGAAAACEFAAWELASQLDAAGPVDWARVAGRAAAELARQAAHLLDCDAPSLADTEALLATTLTAGVAAAGPRGPYASFLQIGDSGAWLLHRGRYHPVGPPKNSPHAAVISSGVTALPRIPARIPAARAGLPPGSVLLIGTDGFGDPLGDGDGLVGRLFAGHLAAPPPARGLAHLLDFSRETFDDDRTLIAIWPLEPGPAARR